METEANTSRFEPRPDPVFQYLLEAAIQGATTASLIEVPVSLLRPFDPFWAPEKSPDGARVVRSMVEHIANGKSLSPIWVYPSGRHLIVSDDYFALACYRLLRADAVPAFHLGTPKATFPILCTLTAKEVASCLGITLKE